MVKIMVVNSGWSNDEWNCSSCGILDGADSVVGKMMVRYRDTGKKTICRGWMDT